MHGAKVILAALNRSTVLDCRATARGCKPAKLAIESLDFARCNNAV